MKKTVSFFMAVLLFVMGSTISVSAQGDAYHWYCAHVKGHVQPTVGSDVAFAEAEGAYFIDRKHTLWESSDRVVYLTFDAGYENGNVAKILDVLKEHEVPAAFFVLGHLVKENTELVLRMTEEGHTVCNHTLSHKNMSRLGEAEMLKELKALEVLYLERTGKELSKYYRPPEGCFSKANLTCAAKNGYTTVFWSFAYPDWDNQKQMSAERATEKIMENIHNGEVMLLHPTSHTNALILGDVIARLKAEGVRFGTLDELTGREG